MIGRGWRAAVAGLVVAGLAAPGGSSRADDPPATKPIKVLLVTGGPYHNYKKQTEILQEGMAKRVPIEWTVVNEEKTETGAKLAIFDKPNWAEGYDLVIHNECYADVDDPAYIKQVVAPHKAGVPAVVLHCAIHTFRGLKTDEWHEFLGVTSVRHGRQHPLEVKNLLPDNPIMVGFPATWTTGNEELYEIRKFWPDSVALAEATETDGKSYPVVWTHQYGKGRVFGTTLPHNDKTMTDPVFLDLLGRGIQWAAGQLDGGAKAAALAPFVVPGVEPRAAAADAPLAEGWPAATRPGEIEVKPFPAYRGAVARAKGGSMASDNVLFYPLFLHISRSNVAMTSPVINTFDPAVVDQPGATGDVAMEFVYRTTETGSAGKGPRRRRGRGPPGPPIRLPRRPGRPRPRPDEGRRRRPRRLARRAQVGVGGRRRRPPRRLPSADGRGEPPALGGPDPGPACPARRLRPRDGPIRHNRIAARPHDCVPGQATAAIPRSLLHCVRTPG